ncbi:MAG: DUF5522 domain-containing protein [Saprospiraceae bacterium]|nr:DUF5522 domain-containing protein [Saprospiraceae bacterium]
MELKEGIDYYIEDGKYVFTAHFLRKRGYCCQSGCRHCPYGFTPSPPASSRPDTQSERDKPTS